MNLRQPEVKEQVEKLLPELYRVLQDSGAPISLKPSLITAVGDIAVGMEEDFIPFLEPFLGLLGHAASTKSQDGPVRSTQADRQTRKDKGREITLPTV